MLEALTIAGLSAAGAMAYAVRGRSASAFGPSVWRGPRDRRAIALTFDDGPSESTEALLRILEAHGARATFFACGAHVRRLPAAARAVVAAGHEIGNHTQDHRALCLRSPGFVRDQVRRGQDSIAEVAGVQCRLFRAPYGARWFGLREVQRELGLMGVMWTAIAGDWRLEARAVAARLTGAAENGAIFCLHDGRGVRIRPDIRATLEAVDQAAPVLIERGYRLVTLTELLWPKTSPNA